MLLYNGGADEDTCSSMGPYTAVVVLRSALKNAATEILALSLLLLATTRCSTLFSLPLLTSWSRSPTLITRAPGTGGTSTHTDRFSPPLPPSTSTWRPDMSSWRSTVRNAGSECRLVPRVRCGCGHGG
uniref:Uncharacterized protein n=1 Tax=Triticum urartu TaxID=4572 RepID=A0A8R7JW34_TRIUA